MAFFVWKGRDGKIYEYSSASATGVRVPEESPYYKELIREGKFHSRNEVAEYDKDVLKVENNLGIQFRKGKKPLVIPVKSHYMRTRNGYRTVRRNHLRRRGG